MSQGDIVLSPDLILIRDDHPDFLYLVAEFLMGAEEEKNGEHVERPDWFKEIMGEDGAPSSEFVKLLDNWVNEDRRVPVMNLKKPSEVNWERENG